VIIVGRANSNNLEPGSRFLHKQTEKVCEQRTASVGAKLARDADTAVFQTDRVIVHREQALLLQGKWSAEQF
jgi:hypothetical protein